MGDFSWNKLKSLLIWVLRKACVKIVYLGVYKPRKQKWGSQTWKGRKSMMYYWLIQVVPFRETLSGTLSNKTTLRIVLPGRNVGRLYPPGPVHYWLGVDPRQYSCLENSMDRGAWQATVHGVTKSWTWLDNYHSLDSISLHLWAGHRSRTNGPPASSVTRGIPPGLETGVVLLLTPNLCSEQSG